MNTRTIDNQKKEIYRLIEQSRLNEAFDHITQFATETSAAQLKDELDQLRMSYSFMLQYLSRGILDPQRDQVLQRIVASLYSVTDRLTITAKESISPEVFYARRRELQNVQFNNIVEQWQAALHKVDLLSSVPQEQQNKTAITQAIQECERHETTAFNKLWSSYPTLPDDATLASKIIQDDNIPAHARCLMLSALFVGLMTLYDEAKLVTIARAYLASTNAEVQVRAIIYTVLTLYVYNSRLSRSTTVAQLVKEMTSCPHFANDMATLQFLLARSRNTDNITRRVREDLMPDIMNMSPDLMRKIRDKNAPLDISDLEANPEWQDMLENSGIARKMEEFNEMQMAGNDVFISTFSHLKSFPFFHTLSNWFLPYHPGHSVLQSTFNEGADTLGTIITSAPLCNSDKYSFCLSMGSIPESQRQMMFNQVKEQQAQLMELKSTELPNDKKSRESIANRHLQDLYRFFKLFSRRREFTAVMDRDMDLTALEMLNEYTRDHTTVSIIAEFYFKNEFYEDAIKYYSLMLKGNDTVDPIVFQKIGFSHQNLGNTREAMRFYKKFLLAHDNDVWTLKHMAACYRALKRPDKAVDYYKQADALQPNSVATTLSIANCLLESGNAVDALQYYYKADFLPGAKHRAWRPIAWCSFITGNNDRALSYYDKILTEDKPTAQDHMNRGHVLLCSGNMSEAVKSYSTSLSLEKNVQSFRDALFNDMPALCDKGISATDIALLADAVTSSDNQQ